MTMKLKIQLFRVVVAELVELKLQVALLSEPLLRESKEVREHLTLPIVHRILIKYNHDQRN